MILIFVLILSSTTVLASSNYQIGGNIKAGMNTLFFDNESNVNLYESLELKLDLDQASFTLLAQNNSNKDKIDLWLKKAYIKYKLKDINLTLGKQPVSWSFGSLVNVVDYSLGAETLDQETNAKYVNALQLQYPINWYSSLSFVTEINSVSKKYGFRGRTLIKNFDLSLNYINQSTEADSISRWGVSLKGDINRMGAYGSYTMIDYKMEEKTSVNTQALMIGADYSYLFNQGMGNRLYLQGEYHLLENNEGLKLLLQSLTGAGVGLEASQNLLGDGYLDVFLTNVNYNINDFSSIGIFTITALKDKSTVVIPNYRNQLTNNTTLNINLSYISGSQSSIFAGGVGMPELVGNIELTYAF